MRLLICLAVLLIAGSAQAEPTVQLWADYGDQVASFVDAPFGAVFEVVVTVKATATRSPESTSPFPRCRPESSGSTRPIRAGGR